MTYLPRNSDNYKLHDTATILSDNNQAIKALLQTTNLTKSTKHLQKPFEVS